MFTFERERERERERAFEQGRGRERGRQDPKQAPGSELSAQGPTQGLNSQTARSRPEPKSAAHRPGPPRHPLNFFNVYLFLGGGAQAHGGGAERRGQRIQSGLHTDSSKPDAGLELKNHEIMT